MRVFRARRLSDRRSLVARGARAQRSAARRAGQLAAWIVERRTAGGRSSALSHGRDPRAAPTAESPQRAGHHGVDRSDAAPARALRRRPRLVKFRDEGCRPPTALSAVADVSRTRGDVLARRRTPTSTSSGSTPTRCRSGGARARRAAARSSTRRPPYRVPHDVRAERSAVRRHAVEPADDQPREGLGHSAAGRIDDHRRGARYGHGVSRTRRSRRRCRRSGTRSAPGIRRSAA